MGKRARYPKVAVDEIRNGVFLVTPVSEHGGTSRAFRIEYGDGWLSFITDDYSGDATVPIETLATVRRTLALIAKRLKSP